MQNKVPVPVQVVEPSFIPTYATASSSGADVYANICDPLIIEPGLSAMVPTGVRVAIPDGYEIQVRPRSGYAAKHQVTILNTPGTIDADYRGEICVILVNHGKASFEVTPKMRIAQLVLTPVAQADFYCQDSLSTTQRGEGKFGHTGTH